MSRTQSEACQVIDPDEVQAWPPEELEPVIAGSGTDYPGLLEQLAIRLLASEPGFREARDACFASYLHPHNFLTPLEPEVEERLREMVEGNQAIDATWFERWVPLVVRKANTLAVETWVHGNVPQAVALMAA